MPRTKQKTCSVSGVKTSQNNFYKRGEDKVRKASEAYDLFYKTKDFDPKQYFISKTL